MNICKKGEGIVISAADITPEIKTKIVLNILFPRIFLYYLYSYSVAKKEVEINGVNWVTSRTLTFLIFDTDCSCYSPPRVSASVHEYICRSISQV
jgi:hypothetical protein